MKKILIVLGITVIAFAVFFSSNAMKPSDGLSSLRLTNLKLIETASAEEGFLNGPAQQYRCGGFLNFKKGLDCMAFNSYNCMPRSCN